MIISLLPWPPGEDVCEGLRTLIKATLLRPTLSLGSHLPQRPLRNNRRRTHSSIIMAGVVLSGTKIAMVLFAGKELRSKVTAAESLIHPMLNPLALLLFVVISFILVGYRSTLHVASPVDPQWQSHALHRHIVPQIQDECSNRIPPLEESSIGMRGSWHCHQSRAEFNGHRLNRAIAMQTNPLIASPKKAYVSRLHMRETGDIYWQALHKV